MCPVPSRSAKVVNTAATSLVTTNETVVATLNGISDDTGDAQVQLSATATLNTGAGTTSVTYRIRRGTTATGALVATIASVGAAAGATVQGGVEGADSPGEVANQSYVLTVQQNGATANGAMQEATLEALY